MKKGQKRKQAKALKRRTQRKTAQKRSKTSLASQMLNSRRVLRAARQYPIDTCWVLASWKDRGISPVLITRRGPADTLIVGNFLVDFWCLGVKNAFAVTLASEAEFRKEYLDKMPDSEALTPISPALAHEMVYGSIDFARQYGFRPHRDFNTARYVLDPPDFYPLSGEVEFGQDGKPFYAAGPYDNAENILRTLERTAGEGNYHYLMPLEMTPDEFDGDFELIELDDEFP